MRSNVSPPDLRHDLIIRPILASDQAGLMGMSRRIWDGHDYLAKVYDRWVADGGFIVAELGGEIIGCVKLTHLPDHVLWFEGLRVHPRHQGKGIGTRLNQYVSNLADSLREKDPAIRYEFCTYYLNHKSLHLTQKAGFRIVERYYILDHAGVVKTSAPEIIEDYDLSIFKHYPGHIPCGWQSVHNAPDSLPWLKSHATIFRTPQGIYLLGGVSDKDITLLNPPPPDLKAELPYFQHFYKPRQRLSIIIPARWKKHLKHLQENKYHFWEKEAVPNMFILAM